MIDGGEERGVLAWVKAGGALGLTIAALITVIITVRSTNGQLKATQKQQNMTQAQLNDTEDAQLTSRFDSAIIHLGSSNKIIQLGGIYALQHIMQAASDTQPTAIRVLSSYIRYHAPKTLVRAGRTVKVDRRHPSANVQVALAVLGLRNPNFDGLGCVDLHDADLTGAELYNFKFDNANLDGAVLDNADLRLASLKGASMRGAKLEDAVLSGAHLNSGRTGCRFGSTRVPQPNNGVDLTNANLSHAKIEHADLRHALLIGIKAVRTDFSCTKLSYTTFSHAKLTGTILRGANLSDARLNDENITSSILSGAFLKGTQFIGTNGAVARRKAEHGRARCAPLAAPRY